MNQSLNTFITSACFFIVLAYSFPAHGQTGAGSATLDNSTMTIAPGTAELIFSEALFLGPESNWEINGTLEIWSRYIWLAPTARIHGTGKLIIHNPGDNLYYESWDNSPTYIDGNGGLALQIDVELRNAYNLVLQQIDNPGFSLHEPTNAESADLNLGKRFVFAVDDGDVLLNGAQLTLAADATLHGYTSRRMVVTGNEVSSKLVKHFSRMQPFTFPVGIAERDYTPATLTPASTAVLHVGVQDYAAAGFSLPDSERGIDRIWNIYAGTGVMATYTLQHNSITNGATYVDAEAQVVQYAGSGNWIGDVTVLEAEGIHTRADILTSDRVQADDTWFTKLSDEENCGPQATDDAAAVESGASAEILVLANDVPCSSPIVVGQVRIIRSPLHGHVTVSSDGSIVYTSHDGFVGSDEFTYEITDENGRVATAQVYITVTPRPLKIPNVFTPNGDGKNDVFEIVGIENFDRISIVIVNRWGNEVYRSNTYKNDWNGGNLNEATYYYTITTYKGSERQDYTGWVLIKRM